MKLVVGSDHAGLELKNAIATHLRQGGHAVIDVGTNGNDSCDYPDFAATACAAVIDGRAERAILVCGSGIGIAIAANKVAGIRCGLVWNLETARLAAEHNRANALAMGGRFIAIEQALPMVDLFLATPFEARHQRRIDKITALEKPTC